MMSDMKGERSLYFDKFQIMSIFRFDTASTAYLACPVGMPMSLDTGWGGNEAGIDLNEDL